MVRAFILVVALAACILPKQPLPMGAHARVYVMKLSAEGVANSAGTGVFVARTAQGSILITAKHVVSGGLIIAVVGSRGGARSRVVAMHPTADLAAVLVPHEAEERAVVATRSPSSGERLRAIGSTLHGEATIADGLVSTGPVRCHAEDRAKGCSLTTIPVGPGHSGAGVFDEEGKLVGIVIAYQEIRPNFSVIVGLAAIKELLASATP